MILRGNEGDLVELTIVGYQFPDDPDPRVRFSWHMVAGNASLDGLAWPFRMAVLTCDESPEVSAWLREAAECADGHREGFPADLSFLEPNLGLRLVAVDEFGQAHIEVDLDLEFRHPDVRRASSAAGEPTAIPVQATGVWCGGSPTSGTTRSRPTRPPIRPSCRTRRDAQVREKSARWAGTGVAGGYWLARNLAFDLR